jgi:hypothetical protein
MDRLSKTILGFALKHSAIGSGNKAYEVYKYGIEITLSSVLNVLLVFFGGIDIE